MSSRRDGAAVFARYWALQLPGMFAAGVVLTLLTRWTELTSTLAAGLFALWVLKDLALFPILRVAYERGGRPHGADALHGALGVAERELSAGAEGWVRIGPELWRARCVPPGPIARGAPVRVRSVEGLLLVVEPVDPEGG